MAVWISLHRLSTLDASVIVKTTIYRFIDI